MLVGSMQGSWFDRARSGGPMLQWRSIEDRAREKTVTRIYVGNLPFSASEDDVRSLFQEYGSVEEVSLVSDRETGRPRGFGFVEMDSQGANAAIQALDGVDYGGRNLRVNEARPREERPPRRDGGYGGSRGGYGRDRDRGGRRNDW